MSKKSLGSKLDPLIKQIEQLDKIQRLLICIGSIAALGAIYYFLLAQPMVKEINSFKSQFKSQSQQLGIAKKKAAQLPRLKKEREMKKTEFKKAMKALPEKREIPSLLTSISQVGQEKGVLFKSFKPVNERVLGFYAEIPVEIAMEGNFHDIIGFFDLVTSMRRIVNIKNVNLGSTKDPNKLEAKCQAVTYRFVEQSGKKKK